MKLINPCLFLSAVVLLSGCIDDKYDLSNIDKTTQINVTDLVIPVNIDDIELSDIITIDADSKIKIVNIDGVDIYAVNQTGVFSSDPIEISGFTAPAPTVEDASASFEIVPELRSRSSQHTSYYTLSTSTPQKVEIKATDIHEAVKEIIAIECKPMTISIDLTTTGFAGAETMIHLKEVKMNFLKGLTLASVSADYSYDADSGELIIKDLPCPGNVARVTLSVTAVDLLKAGAALSGHDLNYTSTVSVKEAELTLTTQYESTPPADPQIIRFSVATKCSDLNATALSGVIEYALKGDALNMEPVSLSDIPDFLSNEQTDIRLSNPQIYLSMNNPMSPYHLAYQTGLMLTALRGADRRTAFPLDAGQLIRVGDSYGTAGPYNYVLSPSMPPHPLSDYSQNLSHVGYASLTNVLSGSGIPESIEIALLDPQIPRQSVTRFPLSTPLPGVEGKYEFFAPLALLPASDGAVASTIVYSGREDGWASEDLDKLTITRLQVSAIASNNLPLDARVAVYPLGRDGKKMEGVTVTPATLKAGTQGQLINIVVEGTITELDGVTYEAVILSTADTPLAPAQAIKLADIRAKVSGYYLTNFE